MSEGEAERLKAGVPTLEDSPTEFKAALDATLEGVAGRAGASHAYTQNRYQ